MEQKQQLGSEKIIWKLSDLYASANDPVLETDIEWCRQEANTIYKNNRTTVASLDATGLYELVSRLENLDSRLQQLETFAFLNHCTQYGNDEAGALEQKIRELTAECATNLVFFRLEWNMLSHEHCHALLSEPKLSHYRYYLETLRRYRSHQLTEAEEKILLAKEPVGRGSWIALFDKILSNYRFGAEKRTEEQVLTDLYNQDRGIRKTAADELTAGLQENSHILTHIFNVLAADKMITDRLRNHTSWISPMNLHNNLDDETVQTLITTVTARYDIVERYYHLKTKLLGLEKLKDYDRYAPLPSLSTQTISWEECKEIVLRSFAAFSPTMADIAKDFFHKQWIHAPVMQGKQGGAFAHPCVPNVHPYVMVNYTGTINDVSTVAHELGHGVHQMLASENGLYNSNTPLPLAETASVFAELLVFNNQLHLIENNQEKQSIICQKLESVFATVFRQTAMNRFEEKMHNGRRKHGELSQKQLSEYWMQTQKAMFGDSVDLREDYSIWWSYIPHFLSTPGYVYSYAFGELLVFALYSIYLKEGDQFVDKYLQLLVSGGSGSPYDLLQPFGIDLNSPEFWNQGIEIIEEMLTRVEQ